MTKRLLPMIPNGLCVEHVLPEPDRITIFVRPRRSSVPCPLCHAPSSRVHSRYERRLADLPWQGRPVILRLQARRFLCREASCPKRTFTERLPGIVQPSARRSERLVDIQRHIALALGGEAGGRLVQRLAMPVSADTLLRLATTAPCVDAPAPRVLGVDEWAWRKGHRYGTILVDLERGDVVDLLPDRDASSFAAWLRAHPGVEVIVRDRADVYADGARQGARSAVHVADRWHLLRNLGDAMCAAVGAHHAAVRRAAIACTSTGAAPIALAPVKPSARDVRKAATHAPRHARYAEVRRLADAGATVSAIARRCTLDRKTVRAWLRDGGPGTWARPSGGGGILAPYLEHLEHRWAEGQRNATALWREIDGQGFTGGRSTVRAWATIRRRTSSDPLDAGPSKTDTWKPPAIRGVARLLQVDRKDLAETDRVFVDTLLANVPALSDMHDLAHRFAALVRKQGTGTLDDWLAATVGTPLERFASGLRKDLAAVRAALETPWSTGPVEGRINRLKTIKRTMYGRAGFELLRSRVLHAA